MDGATPGRRPATRAARRRRLVVAGLAVLGGTVLALAGPTLWTRVSSSGRIHTVQSAPSEPVAIVFGAGLDPDGTPSAFLGYRLDVAIGLYERGAVRVILVSGDNRTAAHDEPTAMRDYLVARGIPNDRVVRDYAGRDTYDTCVRARRIFAVPSAVLVTQDYHLPRALAVCNAVGVPSVGVPDTRARERFPGSVRTYALREVGANVKAVWDIVSQRDPVLGAQESSVTDALRSAGWTG